MLILSEYDIGRSATILQVIKAVEEAFLIQEEGTFNMPRRIHFDHKNNSLLLMPCFRDEYFATKLVSVFPENSSRGIPAIYGSVILNSGVTGEPLSLLNGGKLTALRTGAVGAVAIKYLTPGDIKSIGIIGSGVQGLYQAICACRVRKIEEVHVLSHDSKSFDLFRENLLNYFPALEVKAYKNRRAVVAHADVVITATNSSAPVLPDDPSLLKGKTFIGIGSFKPGMREMPDALYQLVDMIWVDTLHGTTETGDLTYPIEKGWFTPDRIKTLGLAIKESKIVTGDTLFFKSVGMALFDLVVAELIYLQALKKGIGVEVKM